MGAVGRVTPIEGQPVDCYWNLHRRLYSVRARSGPDRGRVVAHADAVRLREVTFVVSEAGRQRVIREGSKNVHAFMRGSWTAAVGDGLADRISYDPYAEPSFVRTADGEPVTTALEVVGVIVDGSPVVSIPRETRDSRAPK